MTKVIAFMDENTCRAFPSVDDATLAGAAAVFSSQEELSTAMSRRDMDAARAAILGFPVPDSPTVASSAHLLWYLLNSRLDIEYPAPVPRIPKTDAFGNPAYQLPAELIEVTYEVGASQSKDLVYRGLRPVPRRLLNEMLASGHKVWSQGSVVALVSTRRAALGTMLPAERVWLLCRWQLMAKNLISSLSYLDFSRKSRYRGQRVA